MPICPNTTIGNLAVAISSTAAKAYKTHTGDEPFSEVEQKKVYQDLLDTISQYQYAGNMSMYLASIQADTNYGDESSATYVRDLLRRAMVRLETSIDNAKETTKKIAPDTVSKSAESHMFPKSVLDLYEGALTQYLEDHPMEKAQTAMTVQTNIGEPGEVPVILGKQPDVVSATALMKRLIDEKGAAGKYLSDIDKYLTQIGRASCRE